MPDPRLPEFFSEDTADILIVDDKPENLRLLSTMLTGQGYKVRKAVNGERALQAANAVAPDLILLDVMMPGMNGYETCDHLKAAPETQGIPIVFVSALDDTQGKVKAFKAGGVDYITKPFQEQEVLARVKTHLTLSRLQKQVKAASDLKDEMLRLVVQELIGPVNGLEFGITKLLEPTTLQSDRQTRTLLEAMAAMTEKLQSLTMSLLGLSTMPTGQHVELPSVSLNNLLQDFVSAFVPLAQLKQQQLVYIPTVGTDLPCKLDANSVGQVVACLLANVLRQTPEGEAVSCSAFIDAQQAIIQIKTNEAQNQFSNQVMKVSPNIEAVIKHLEAEIWFENTSDEQGSILKFAVPIAFELSLGQ